MIMRNQSRRCHSPTPCLQSPHDATVTFAVMRTLLHTHCYARGVRLQLTCCALCASQASYVHTLLLKISHLPDCIRLETCVLTKAKTPSVAASLKDWEVWKRGQLAPTGAPQATTADLVTDTVRQALTAVLQDDAECARMLEMLKLKPPGGGAQSGSGSGMAAGGAQRGSGAAGAAGGARSGSGAAVAPHVAAGSGVAMPFPSAAGSAPLPVAGAGFAPSGPDAGRLCPECDADCAATDETCDECGARVQRLGHRRGGRAVRSSCAV
jgi:hypothetical protein